MQQALVGIIVAHEFPCHTDIRCYAAENLRAGLVEPRAVSAMGFAMRARLRETQPESLFYRDTLLRQLNLTLNKFRTMFESIVGENSPTIQQACVDSIPWSGQLPSG
jgi:hypothetical protein